MTVIACMSLACTDIAGQDFDFSRGGFALGVSISVQPPNNRNNKNGDDSDEHRTLQASTKLVEVCMPQLLDMVRKFNYFPNCTISNFSWAQTLRQQISCGLPVQCSKGLCIQGILVVNIVLIYLLSLTSLGARTGLIKAIAGFHRLDRW